MRGLIFTAVQVLLLFSIALAKKAPTGCVKIWNDQHGYLKISSRYDNDRRHVAADGGAGPEWKITAEGDHYTIQHVELEEPLYAATEGFAYDSYRRRVFTWFDGGRLTQGQWYIVDIGAGRFTIINKEFGEYLYAADFPSSGSVFTWRPKGWLNNSKFKWQFIKC